MSAALAADHATASGGNWNFRVTLDGRPIGQHRFSVEVRGDEREVTSEASFAVKFLGFTVYRYRHKATERWRGECLAGLAATTEDGGKARSVRLEPPGNVLTVNHAATPPLEGCVMSFAYWNPAIRTQTRLLNVQTGKLEAVHVEQVGSASIDVHGKAVAATDYRITGPAQPIDVWYSAGGEWVGLDASVEGGRKLSYRLP